MYPCDNGNEGNDGQKSRFLLLAFPHSDNPGHIVVMHIDVTVLVSIFANFRREAVSDDVASDHSARPAVSIEGEAEQTFLALVDETSKLTQQPYSQIQRAGRHPALSKRQMDVLALMTKGMTNAEIAHELRLSLNTVKVYVSGILARLGLQSRAQVLHWALTRQWENGED
jgi:DNA-binding CsgD family transcriptional regulator